MFNFLYKDYAFEQEAIGYWYRYQQAYEKEFDFARRAEVAVGIISLLNRHKAEIMASRYPSKPAQLQMHVDSEIESTNAKIKAFKKQEKAFSFISGERLQEGREHYLLHKEQYYDAALVHQEEMGLVTEYTDVEIDPEDNSDIEILLSKLSKSQE